MLTATLLEPKVALYQSYLGKAYYQARPLPRRPVGAGVGQAARPARPDAVALRQLLPARPESAGRRARRAAPGDRAQRLPRRLSQPPAARSRSRDQERQPGRDLPAARVRGLGRVRGAQLARNRPHQRRAPTCFSPRPTAGCRIAPQALGSELLQYFLYAPVNRNVVQQLRRVHGAARTAAPPAGGDGGSRHAASTCSATSSSRTGNERFATSRSSRLRGGTAPARRGRRPRAGVLPGQGGVRPAQRPVLQLQRRATTSRRRQSGTTTWLRPRHRRRRSSCGSSPTPDPNRTNRFMDAEITLGFKHQWRAGSVLTASARYDDLEQTATMRGVGHTSLCTGFDLDAVRARVSNGIDHQSRSRPSTSRCSRRRGSAATS